MLTTVRNVKWHIMFIGKNCYLVCPNFIEYMACVKHSVGAYYNAADRFHRHHVTNSRVGY